MYVIGDTGQDLLDYADRTIDVPSGAPFLKATIEALAGAKLRVVGLNALARPEGADSDIASCDAMLPRRLTLKPQEEQKKLEPREEQKKVVRLVGYDAISKGKGKARDSAKLAWLKVPSEPAERSLLIAHHAGDAWIGPSQQRACEFIQRFFGRGTNWLPSGMPRMIVNVSSMLPEVDLESPDAPFKSPLWNKLFPHRSQVAIVLSLSTLRREGGAVSKRLSWEQNVEDVTAEVHLFPRLNVLSRFSHLFIRCGTVGTIHIENSFSSASRTSKLCGTLYYTPYANGVIHRSHELHGGFVGKNAIFVSSLALAIAAHALCPSRDQRPLAVSEGDDQAQEHSEERLDRERKERSKTWADAIARALRTMRKVDDAGYESALRSKLTGEAFVKEHMRLAEEVFPEGPDQQPGSDDTTSCRPIPEHLMAAPLPDSLRSPQRWYILDEVLLEAPVHRINVAMAIVKRGHRIVLNRQWMGSESDEREDDRDIWRTLTRVEYMNPKDRAPDFVTLEEGDRPATPQWPGGKTPKTLRVIGDIRNGFILDVPVATFGRLTLVERDEVEGFRGIDNLIQSYRARVKHRRETQPLSIAVFGPPGSGKSFGVKEIAGVIGNEQLPMLEFNVAQFRSPGDLREAFSSVKKMREKRMAEASEKRRDAVVTPLVFFDEFDCAVDGRELAWLKYFLAPMQDSKFGLLDELGPAVFVFAGGIYSSFERFDPSTDRAYDNLRDLPEYKSRLRSFVEHKGPDFTSRLRGHINVLGINDAAGRVKHFIRRSLQLRGILSKTGFVHEGDDGAAKVDDAIIYALLTVDRYRHGVRSMQAIIEMCSPTRGYLEIASLPSMAQLEMHVDADEFVVRVNRGRARTQHEWDYDMPVLDQSP